MTKIAVHMVTIEYSGLFHIVIHGNFSEHKNDNLRKKDVCERIS